MVSEIHLAARGSLACKKIFVAGCDNMASAKSHNHKLNTHRLNTPTLVGFLVENICVFC
jgi:hypothetical protein